jgi:HD-like signal output (HDOD) protein
VNIRLNNVALFCLWVLWDEIVRKRGYRHPLHRLKSAPVSPMRIPSGTTVNPDLETKLKTCTTLPTLSAVALEVLRLCEAEQLDLRDMARVVGRDPALAIKVVRTANSPLFALRQNVVSIDQALSLLGANVVRTLVLSFSLVNELQDERQGPLARCWHRSVFASVIARCLCVGPRAAVKEEAFLAALLQDMGMMALARIWGSDYESLCGLTDMSHEELQAAETAAFGCDHAEVGAWLLAHWGMPKSIVQLVAQSHQSEAAPSASFLTRCVQHSGRLADLWSSQVSDTAMSTAISEIQSLLGGGESEVQNLATKAISDLKAIAPLFQLTIEARDLETWVGGLLPVTA